MSWVASKAAESVLNSAMVAHTVAGCLQAEMAIAVATVKKPDDQGTRRVQLTWAAAHNPELMRRCVACEHLCPAVQKLWHCCFALQDSRQM